MAPQSHHVYIIPNSPPRPTKPGLTFRLTSFLSPPCQAAPQALSNSPSRHWQVPLPGPSPSRSLHGSFPDFIQVSVFSPERPSLTHLNLSFTAHRATQPNTQSYYVSEFFYSLSVPGECKCREGQALGILFLCHLVGAH